MNYFDNISDFCKAYFPVLLAGEEMPEFIQEYVNTPEMLKQNEIGVRSGVNYSKIGECDWYSSLDHSIAVALVVWHFTHDKVQTLAGLFHDIATPAFKHSIDFMNGDYENQESTEEFTTKIIRDSKEIMALLNRDGIKLEEVDDYHLYPIADNDTPRLAADRLEYTLSNGLGAFKRVWTLEDVKEVYRNIVVLENEDGLPEVGFTDLAVAEKFVRAMRQLSIGYMNADTKFCMQFVADTMRKMSEKGLVTVKDLYTSTEAEIIEKIENCKEGNIARDFKHWREADTVYESDEPVDGKICMNIERAKTRYINPLVKTDNGIKRIKDISKIAEEEIQKALNYKTKKYGYIA